MILRPYQLEALESVMRELQARRSTMMVLPTGTGKTVVFAHVIRQFLERGRVMVLAHRQELIEQAADKIKRITDITPATEMGQEWSNEDEGFFGKPRVVVSSIQTQIASSRGAARMIRFDPSEFSLLVIDEFHHATASSYRKVLAHYQKNETLRVLGCTATPDRADEQALSQVCESCAFQYQIDRAIDDGWLVPISQRLIYVKNLDFSSMRTTAGDLNGKDLADCMEQEEQLHGIADPTFREAGNRPTLVFACSVKQAERLAEILNRHEPNCARSVCGMTPDFVRRETFSDFAEGRYRFLVNVGITTEGWDCPRVAVVVMARPTKSRSLYSQMLGRGTRPLAGILDSLETADLRRAAIASSEKPMLELLDFCGNAGRHKLIHGTDVLGGLISDEVQQIAEKIIGAAKTAIPIRDAVEQARKHLAIEKSKAEEAARRKAIVGKASYSSRTIDPFKVLDIEPTREMPAYRNQKALSEKQKKILESQGVNHEALPLAQSFQILGEIFRRWDAKLCSLKQAKLLKDFGFDPNTRRDQAGLIIDRLKANGWKRWQ